MSEDSRRGWGEAWTLGFTLVGVVLALAGLGYLADRWFGTSPWLMVVGVFAGAGIGFMHLLSMLFSRSRGAPDRRGFWR